MSAINGSVLLLIIAAVSFAFLALMTTLATGENMYTDTDHQKNREAAARYGTEYAHQRPGLDAPLSGEYADDLTPAQMILALGIETNNGMTYEDEMDLCYAFEDAYHEADNVCLCPTWTDPHDFDGPADYASAIDGSGCPLHANK